MLTKFEDFPMFMGSNRSDFQFLMEADLITWNDEGWDMVVTHHGHEQLTNPKNLATSPNDPEQAATKCSKVVILVCSWPVKEIYFKF